MDGERCANWRVVREWESSCELESSVENWGAVHGGRVVCKLESSVRTEKWYRKGRVVCELESSARTDNHKGYQFSYRLLTNYRYKEIYLDFMT